MVVNSPLYDLVLDLARVLKKHGASRFRELAACVRELGKVAELAEMLETFGGMGAKRPKRSRKEKGKSCISVLMEKDPLRFELLTTLKRRLSDSSVPMAEVRRLASAYGVREEVRRSRRSSLVSKLMGKLSNAPLDDLEKLQQSLGWFAEQRSSDLAGWSKIIRHE